MDMQASILDCLVVDRASLNRIMIEANLNRISARVHLTRMASERLIHVTDGPYKWPVYSISEKGIRWLKHYKSLLNEGGLNHQTRGRESSDFQMARHHL
jgi:predicted transcriptional regulator